MAQRCTFIMQRCGKALPDFAGDLRDQTDFVPLLGFTQAVALFGREAKPHCGLRHICSFCHVFAASSRRALIPSGFSSSPFFVVISPSTTCCLPGRMKRNGAKSPLRSLIVFKEKRVNNVDRPEQHALPPRAHSRLRKSRLNRKLPRHTCRPMVRSHFRLAFQRLFRTRA